MSKEPSELIKSAFLETKYTYSEIKLDENDEMRFSGWANVYDIKDMANDITKYGCCAKTLSEKGNLRQLFYAHKVDLPNKLGYVEVTEKQQGIWVEGKLDDNEKCRDVYRDMKKKIINQMSIGYRVIKAKFDAIENEFVRIITELKLFEVSLLPAAMACNEASMVTDVKTIDDLYTLIINNKNDEELKNKIFSLYGYKPEDLPTLKKPGENSTFKSIEEPKRLDMIKILNAIR